MACNLVQSLVQSLEAGRVTHLLFVGLEPSKSEVQRRVEVEAQLQSFF